MARLKAAEPRGSKKPDQPTSTERSAADSAGRFEQEPTVDEPRTQSVNITAAISSLAAETEASVQEFAERVTMAPGGMAPGGSAATQRTESASHHAMTSALAGIPPAPSSSNLGPPHRSQQAGEAEAHNEFQGLEDEVTLQRDFSSLGLNLDDLDEPTSVLPPITPRSATSASNAPSAGGSVPPGSMAPGSVPPGSMAPGSVPPGSMAPGSVPPGSMAPGSVPPGGMAPDSVPPGSMAPDSVPPGASSSHRRAHKRNSGLPIVSAVRVAVLRTKTGEVRLVPVGANGSIPVGSASATLVPSSDADSDAINKMLSQSISGRSRTGRP